jgi:hypothetical protein
MTSLGSARHRYCYLAEHISQMWIPADQRQDWLLVRRSTGRRVWLLRSEQEAVRAGLDIREPWPTGRWRAPYGDFFAAASGRQPGSADGCWQSPTPSFLATLPRDPRQLLNRLQADSPNDRPGYSGVFTYATDALRTGLVPAGLRAVFYQALLLLPATQIADVPGDGVGQHVSLRHDDGTVLREIFIETANGQFAGERATLTSATHELPAGSVTTCTAVSIATLDAAGQEPSSAQPPTGWYPPSEWSKDPQDTSQ